MGNSTQKAAKAPALTSLIGKDIELTTRRAHYALCRVVGFGAGTMLVNSVQTVDETKGRRMPWMGGPQNKVQDEIPRREIVKVRVIE